MDQPGTETITSMNHNKFPGINAGQIVKMLDPDFKVYITGMVSDRTEKEIYIKIQKTN